LGDGVAGVGEGVGEGVDGAVEGGEEDGGDAVVSEDGGVGGGGGVDELGELDGVLIACAEEVGGVEVHLVGEGDVVLDLGPCGDGLGDGDGGAGEGFEEGVFGGALGGVVGLAL